MRLCFATNNRHKVEEVGALLPDQFTLLTLREIGCNEELPEEQETLEGNSLQKAKYVFDQYGIACVADDTGLEVKALNGRPGVYSARYAGNSGDSEANMAKLLDELNGISERTARFRTVITLILKENEVYQFEGFVDGQITRQRSGSEGFGYDPLFIPEGFNTTFAEMAADQKNEISHRGRAVRKLIDFLISR
ncbi:MAG: non-canonical purine NTP diphosphatase [Cyclobacteriaceae bacterium]